MVRNIELHSERLVDIFTGKHTIFGRVSGGIGVVNRIGLSQTDDNDRCTHSIHTYVSFSFYCRPTDDVLIQQAYTLD